MSEPGSQTLSLFPLELVLVPGEHLPLHIFEERYKRMVGLARATGGPFGIVLKLGNGVAAVGCSARLVEVLEEFPDGRLNIIVRGESPFRLLELVFPDDPDLEPLSAEVEFLEEVPAEVPAGLVDRAERLAGRVSELAQQSDDPLEEALAAESESEVYPEPGAASEPQDEDLDLDGEDEAESDLGPEGEQPGPGGSEGERPTAFSLAADVDLEVTLKQRLLQLTNEAERLQLLANYLDTLVSRMEILRERRDAIRGNGKGY